MCLQAVLLSVLEALIRHIETVTSNADVILDALMPALVAAVSADVSGDMRFGCLKVLGDVVAMLVFNSRPGVYSPGHELCWQPSEDICLSHVVHHHDSTLPTDT